MNTQHPLTRRISLLAVLAITLALAVLPVFFAGRHGRVLSAREPVAVVLPAPAPARGRWPEAAAPTAAPMTRPVPDSLKPAGGTAARIGTAGVTNRTIPWEPIGFSLLACLLLILAGALRVWRRARPVHVQCALVVCLVLPLVGCGVPGTSQPAQSPTAYLHGALDWMQAHSVFSRRTNWTMLRRQAMEAAHGATTTAGTYGAIELALARLGDRNGFFLSPTRLTNSSDPGFRATYPGRLVVDVQPGSPAARAGLRVGDTIETINGASPKRFEGLHSMDLGVGSSYRLVLRRPGQLHRLTLSFSASPSSSVAQCSEIPRGRSLRWDHHTAGYLELPVDCGTPSYAGVGQALIRAADRAGACGWLLDLRNNDAGDIWSYLAAIGPILGGSRLGGFVYPDGRREAWAYRGGEIFWNGQVRPESKVSGKVYLTRRSMPPLAVLTGRFTSAAGELVDVALRGRPRTHFIGEPTQGVPTLTLGTPLSDGARVELSGAFSYDRTGRTYNGPIMPETQASTDWAHFGSVQDPAVQAALRWLQRQPSCTAASTP